MAAPETPVDFIDYSLLPATKTGRTICGYQQDLGSEKRTSTIFCKWHLPGRGWISLDFYIKWFLSFDGRTFKYFHIPMQIVVVWEVILFFTCSILEMTSCYYVT